MSYFIVLLVVILGNCLNNCLNISIVFYQSISRIINSKKKNPITVKLCKGTIQAEYTGSLHILPVFYSP